MRRRKDTQTLDLFAEGQAGRDEGMTQAVEHADDVDPGWSTRAAEMLRAYLPTASGPFIAPEVRAWAYERGLPKPTTNMAWGAVFMSFAKRGLIKRAGYTQYGDKTMHTQSVAVWERP